MDNFQVSIFEKMNKYLITIGIVCSLIWVFITAMTLGLPVDWCIALDKATFGMMSDSVFRMAHGFYYDVNNNDMPTIIFLGLFFTIFLLTTFLFLKIEKGPTQRHSLFIIIFFAVLFRIIVLPGELIHENDIYRYLWDGKTFNQRINPYKYAPTDLFVYENDIEHDYYDDYHDVTVKGRRFTEDEKPQIEALIQQRDKNPIFYNRIGHSQVPTIYPPAMQVLFALSTWIKQDSILVMKSIFVLFDMGVIWLIVKFLRYFKKNPSLCLLYAWSPLVLKEFANSGHYDAVAVFFMLLGLFFLIKKRNQNGILALALATLSKFFAFVLLPILRKGLKSKDIFMYGLIMIGAYIPFIVMNDTGFYGVFEGFLTYNREWAYNSSIFAFVLAVFKQFTPLLAVSLFPAKFVVGVMYLGILYFLSKHHKTSAQDTFHRCFLALAALFIISPVGDPWYFCWIMPFLCIFPYRSWILLSGLLILSYLNFRSDIFILGREFFHIPLLNWIIYLPFFVLFYLERKRKLC